MVTPNTSSSTTTTTMPELLLNNLIMYPRAFLRTTIVIIHNIYCLPTYVIWMTLLLPMKRYNPDLYYRIEGYIFHWLQTVVAVWSYTAGYDILEVGDDITPCQKKHTKTLVIANHQSTADVPMMMACFNVKSEVIPNIMWIMDRLFKYTNFGIVSLIHQDYFITSGKEGRDESLRNFKCHLEASYVPRNRRWMVLFPEGGFLRKRREVSQRYAQKNNLPELNNVTLPRIGALKTIFEVLPVREAPCNNNSPKIMGNGTSKTNSSTLVEEVKDISNDNHLDYVLDITIAYQDGIPLDLPTIIHGLRYPCQTYFYYRLYHTSEIPKEDDALTKWLYDRWTEKEKILENFYKTGTFSNFTSNAPQKVQQDMLRFLIINLFFITSSYVHLQMVYWLMGYCNNLYIYSFT